MSSPNPIVITDQDHVYTTSLVVAEKFDKLHKNVLRDIEAILQKCPDKDFNRLNFEPVNYIDSKGESRPMYNLTRQGFTMLAMGFTGSKAFLWKIAFINAFDRMEQLLTAALVTEHHALLDNLFTRHPQWQETADYTRQGLTTCQVAQLQGKAASSVRAMKARIRAAGIDLKPSPEQAAA